MLIKDFEHLGSHFCITQQDFSCAKDAEGNFHYVNDFFNIEVIGPNEDFVYREFIEVLYHLWKRCKDNKPLNIEEKLIQEKVLSNILEVDLCVLCGKIIRPKNEHFALIDDGFNWYHIKCLKRFLPKVIFDKKEKDKRQLEKLKKINWEK